MSLVAPAPVSAAPPTRFENELSRAIDVAWGKGSGTVWRGVQAILGPELGYAASAVGAISVTEEGVVNNRPLSAGLITTPRKFLLIVVGPKVGIAKEAEAVRNLIPLTRHLTTVGLVELVDNVWRVRQIIEVDGVGIGDSVRQHFPLVADVEKVPLVDIGQPPAGVAVDQPTLDHDDAEAQLDPDEVALEVGPDLNLLISALVEDLTTNQFVFPDLERLARSCVLALLRGHLILHGPPGTAKTTLASILVKTFGCSESLHTATADWTTYDVIGGFRPGTDSSGNETLVPHLGCVTDAVQQCQQAVEANLARRSGQQANWLIIDELNRADIDRAIGPLYTALGGGARSIPLWFADDDLGDTLTVPRRFRILATMNDVDTAYVTELSQGLARRFTFVYVGVPDAKQVGHEAQALDGQARQWLIEQFPSLLGNPKTDAEAAAAALTLSQQQSYVDAIAQLNEFVTWIRYEQTTVVGGDTASGPAGSDDDPLGDDDQDVETDDGLPSRSPRWPLGTAQLLDVHRQLLLGAATSADMSEILDDAIAQSIVPQFANAPRAIVAQLEARLSSSRWTGARAGARRILNPLST